MQILLNVFFFYERNPSLSLVWSFFVSLYGAVKGDANKIIRLPACSKLEERVKNAKMQVTCRYYRHVTTYISVSSSFARI